MDRYGVRLGTGIQGRGGDTLFSFLHYITCQKIDRLGIVLRKCCFLFYTLFLESITKGIP